MDTPEPARGDSLLRTVATVALALALAFALQAFVIKPYRIPSESMVPTLKVGQRVVVNRLADRFTSPKVGQVIVFHPPRGYETQQCGNHDTGTGTMSVCDRPVSETADAIVFIKRVVGAPGDLIALDRGRVVRNGERVNEPWAQVCDPDAECDFPQAIRVPAGHYYVLGDNRGNSNDGRFWGPVPREWIIGRAFATYWPLGRIGRL